MLSFVLVAIAGTAIGVSVGFATQKKHIPEREFVQRAKLQKVLRSRNIEIGEETECAVCHKKVELENIGKIIPVNNTYNIICDDDACLLMQHNIKTAS